MFSFLLALSLYIYMQFHRKFIQSVNSYSGMNFHMQLQLRNFPELFVYTFPFSRCIIVIYRSTVYRHPPALPPAPLSSLVLCYHFSNLLRAQRSLQAGQPLILGKNSGSGCTAKSLGKTAPSRANKSPEKKKIWVQSRIPGKTALAERTKSLEKQHFWVQSELHSWEKQHFGVQSELNPRKKQHFWVQSEQNPWGRCFVFLGSGLVYW